MNSIKTIPLKKLLIISFDLIRTGESHKSLAISSILSYLKSVREYENEFLVEHLSINMFELNNKSEPKDFHSELNRYPYENISLIALSAYIWNEFLTNKLISYIRREFDFIGEFVLGGYQISYSNNPIFEYPDCKYFINGYAENALLDLIKGNETKRILSKSIDFNEIPSPYLTNELPIIYNQKMVRLETKRGCPYQCTFCAHRDLVYNKVYKHQLDKVFEEISFFKQQEVKKINIVDPIFNAGKEYLPILEEMKRIDLTSLISVQARFETIKGEKGLTFLELCTELNITLEFGLQTAIQEESKIINRKNDPEVIKKVMQKLKEREIDFEISLIYGLPNQTLDSFKYSIDFARQYGCTKITAFPLMLLKGTEIYQQKEQFNFREETIGDYNIPVVVESNTFTNNEWLEMNEIAHSLTLSDRI